MSSAKQLRDMIAEGEVKSVDAVGSVFERIEKILRILYFRLRFQQMPDPTQMIFFIFGLFLAVFILPMRLS